MGCSYYTCDVCKEALTEYDGINQGEFCSKRCWYWVCWECLEYDESYYCDEWEDDEKVACVACKKYETECNLKIENKTKLLALMRDMKISKRNRDDIIEYITNNKMA